MNFSYGSVCSGIEAATVAWQPLGWSASWLSEIESFPSAVLKHHYPDVPNLGDMTKIRDKVKTGEIDSPDVLVGGTPCQAFSVAGARQSLDDDRGQLTLEYVRLLNEIDTARLVRGEQPTICVWENVPGVLNTKDNAFGCFLGALAGEDGELQPSGKKWTNSGCVFGPQRAIAWRTLDAQYFGVAQRRRRVFVVASSRKGFNPCEVLFESEGLRRDTPPSRSAGQEATGSIGASPYIASGKPAVGTLMANAGTKLWLGNQEAFSGDYAIIHPQNDNYAFGIPGNWIGRKPENGGNATEPMDNIAPYQTKTDRHAVAFGIQGSMIGRSETAGPQGSGVSDDISFTLTKGDRHAVSYSFDSLASNSMKSSNPHSGCREVDLAKTIDTTVPCPSKNQGGIAILQGQENVRGDTPLVADTIPLNSMTMLGRPSDDLKPRMGLGVGSETDPQNTLTKNHHHAVCHQSVVRRLTPIECERLQGFPDNYTKIPYRNKSVDDCPDGPRYAACGNSMAVPVMRWIGQRIQDYLSKTV